MNQEVKRKWVAKLRSLGEDMHAFGVLMTKDGAVCPLGALCLVYANLHPKILTDIEEAETDLSFTDHAFLEWLEADPNDTWEDPVLCHPDYGRKNITSLNDGYHVPFSDFADMIEEQL